MEVHFLNCFPSFIRQLFHIVEIDKNQGEIHKRRGVGLDEQRVNGENSASDGVDDSQLHNRGHQHGDNDQCGAQVPEQFN